MIHNIHEYKRAKVIVKELEKIISILDAVLTSLSGYKKYRPIMAVLTTVLDAKDILDLKLQEQKIILETKGAKKL